MAPEKKELKVGERLAYKKRIFRNTLNIRKRFMFYNLYN